MENVVAPLAGARFEISVGYCTGCRRLVAPLAGARIEIRNVRGRLRALLRRSSCGSED